MVKECPIKKVPCDEKVIETCVFRLRLKTIQNLFVV